MYLLKGKVSSLRHSLSNDSSHQRISHTAIFDINKQPVILTFDLPIVVENDDCLSVAGQYHQGIFHAYAYNNSSKNVVGGIGLLAQIFSYGFASIFIFVGLFFLIGSLVWRGEGDFMGLLMGFAFTPAGLFFIYKTWVKVQSMRLVQNKSIKLTVPLIEKLFLSISNKYNNSATIK